MNILLVSLGAFLVAGCSLTPQGLQPVGKFEVERYLGTWYEIARLDHRFERGLSHVSADYSRRDDDGIRVVNRGYDRAKKKWKEATGRAYFTGDSDVARLKVSFFRPFYGGYNVIALDRDDYSWALVCGPSRDYLWVLARSRKLDDATLRQVLEAAAGMGFDTGKLIYPEHHTPTD